MSSSKGSGVKSTVSVPRGSEIRGEKTTPIPEDLVRTRTWTPPLPHYT